MLDRNKWMDTEELKELIHLLDARCRNHNLRMLILMGIAGGFRISEMLALKTSAIYDSKRNTISEFAEVLGKRNKWRRVPLNQWIQNHLLQFITWKREQGHDMERGNLFESKLENQLSYASALQSLKRFAKKVGLTKLNRFHILRHSCISALVSNNVPLHTIRDIAGHSSLQVTSIYSHCSEREMQVACEGLKFGV